MLVIKKRSQYVCMRETLHAVLANKHWVFYLQSVQFTLTALHSVCTPVSTSTSHMRKMGHRGSEWRGGKWQGRSGSSVHTLSIPELFHLSICCDSEHLISAVDTYPHFKVSIHTNCLKSKNKRQLLSKNPTGLSLNWSVNINSWCIESLNDDKSEKPTHTSLLFLLKWSRNSENPRGNEQGQHPESVF